METPLRFDERRRQQTREHTSRNKLPVALCHQGGLPSRISQRCSSPPDETPRFFLPASREPALSRGTGSGENDRAPIENPSLRMQHHHDSEVRPAGAGLSSSSSHALEVQDVAKRSTSTNGKYIFFSSDCYLSLVRLFVESSCFHGAACRCCSVSSRSSPVPSSSSSSSTNLRMT